MRLTRFFSVDADTCELWCYIVYHVLFYLTLKTPRKPASENVVYLCRLLNILANFSNLFLHTGKQCGPRSDCS